LCERQSLDHVQIAAASTTLVDFSGNADDSVLDVSAAEIADYSDRTVLLL
jgi:hypothetical protein